MRKIPRRAIPKNKKNKIIDTISSCLRRHHGEICIAYLFGSFVTDKAFADIDLGVFLKHEFEDALEYELELESKLDKVVKYPMDVRILNNAPISFIQNVIRNGIVIVNNDPNIRADFECHILKKYFDFARFRRRYLSEVINAPI